MNQTKTATERQKERRKKLKDADMRIMYVRGKGGYYDERVRVALAVQRMAEEGLLQKDTLNLIIEKSIDCMPPNNKIDRLYLQKIISEYLNSDEGERNHE